MKMKLLMENFKKFIEDEDGAENQESGNAVDDVLDAILSNSLMESMYESESPEGMPSKDQVKSEIKAVLNKPEVKSELDAIGQDKYSVADSTGFYEKAFKDFASGNGLKVILGSLAASPVLGVAGAFLGSVATSPSEHKLALMVATDPAAYSSAMQAVESASSMGGTVGMIIGAAVTGLIVAAAFLKIKERAQQHADAQQ